MMSCTVCGSANTKEYIRDITSIYSDRHYALTRCLDCSNTFTDPQPTPNELDAIYTNAYQYKVHEVVDNEKKYRARKLSKYICRHVGKSDVVLEFGCMYGHLLGELKSLGHKCIGVEIDSGAVSACNAQGISVIRSSVEDFDAQGNQYDLIIMSHVLEHFHEPAAVLQKVRKMLSAGGKLLLVVPNSDACTTRLFGRFWGYWQVPVHLNHFNKSSLTMLLGHHGLRVLHTKYHGADSLFFLSSLANVVRLRSVDMQLSRGKVMIIQLVSCFMRYWRAIGNEDLVIVAGKASDSNA